MGSIKGKRKLKPGGIEKSFVEEIKPILVGENSRREVITGSHSECERVKKVKKKSWLLSVLVPSFSYMGTDGVGVSDFLVGEKELINCQLDVVGFSSLAFLGVESAGLFLLPRLGLFFLGSLVSFSKVAFRFGFRVLAEFLRFLFSSFL